MLSPPDRSFRAWSRLTITGIYTVDSPIKIGMDRRTFEQLRNQASSAVPSIPAGTLRGALHAAIGAIARSWTAQLVLPKVTVTISGTGGRPQSLTREVWIACDPRHKRADDPAFQGCLNEVIVARWKADPLWESALSQRVELCTCAVCRLFGTPWLAGRIMVGDLVPIGVGGATFLAERRVGDSEKGRLVWPIGAQFRFWLSVEAADYVEQGLVLLGIYALSQGQILLGGDRVRGSGRGHLAVDWSACRCWETDHLLEGLRLGLNSGGVPFTEEDAQRRFVALEAWLSGMARHDEPDPNG